MRLGLLSLDIHIPAANSLKDKRRVIKSLRERIRRRCNVSIAEVDYQDKWQRATLAIVAVTSDSAGMDRVLLQVQKLVDGYDELEVLESRMEHL